MTPLIPFAISALGAILSELSGEGSGQNTQYGATATSLTRVDAATPVAGSAMAATQLKTGVGETVARHEIAPTRFTKGTTLANIAKAGTHKKVVTETDNDDETEEDKEEYLDPREVVHRKIEQELLIDAITNEVVEDMGLGFDPDLEESLPTDKEFLDKYEPLDAPDEDKEDEEEFGAILTQSIFAPGTGWGIQRQR